MFAQKKTRIIVSSVLLLIALCGIGAVWAWNAHHVALENVLTSHTVDVEIKEDFEPPDKLTGTVTKDVDFYNAGNGAVFLRFAYAEYWETEDELLATDAYSVTKNWNGTFNNKWYNGNDGWYYYKAVLPAGGTVNVLDSVTFGDGIPDDVNYTLMFQVETVQASDEEDINTRATTLLFNKVGTITNATYSNGAVTGGTVTWTEVSG